MRVEAKMYVQLVTFASLEFLCVCVPIETVVG